MSCYLMENYRFTIEIDGNQEQFEVSEYARYSGKTCMIRVYKTGERFAGFNLDKQHLLHLCQNPAGLPETTLHQIADYLEAHFAFGGKHYDDGQ